MPLLRDFYTRDTVIVAQALLGKILVYSSPQGVVSGRIVETEAYIAEDPANQAFKGITSRNKVMFGEAGHAYIYFIYGKYYCFNVVTLPGEAVLIRALEPTKGVDLMCQRRKTDNTLALCSGPAKLVMAMGITPEMNGKDITDGNLVIEDAPVIPPEAIVTTNRIGIVKAAEKPLRFYIKNSPFVSKR